jgi:hypothetical protein
MPFHELVADQIHDDFHWLLRSLRADAVMMINAFFDESGTHDGSPAMSVAGYLYEAEQSERLDAEWAETIAQFGVSIFRMSKCAHAQEEFAGLSTAERSDLVQRLVGIIKRRMRIGIAISVKDAEFEVASPPEWKGGSYAFCVLQCLLATSAWANRYDFKGKISYFFEAGHENQKAADRAITHIMERPLLFAAMRYQSHTFACKTSARPLQSADLLAYEWNKEIIRITSGGTPARDMRRSLESLIDQTHIQKHFTAPMISAFFAGRDQGLPEELLNFEIVE